MGVSFLRGSSCKASECAVGTARAHVPVGNPNPRNFKIMRSYCIDSLRGGTACVVEVVYPDARNFEGRKIMVYLCHLSLVEEQKVLDPHFCDDRSHVSPFARFEPTDLGWRTAIDLLQMLFPKFTRQRGIMCSMDGLPLLGVYRHYKGGLYTLIMWAMHHETRQPIAIYVSHDHGGVSARPLFKSESDPDGWLTTADGRPRFVYVGEQVPTVNQAG